jgi:hypothetical protein
MRKAVIALFVVTVVAIALVGRGGHDFERRNSTSETSERGSRITAEAISSAQEALRNEPVVRDLLYQPKAVVQWQVGVIDNGTSRVGLANYVCELLSQHRAIEPNTRVRIVDIAQISAGESFRSASLGHVACADRRVIEH